MKSSIIALVAAMAIIGVAGAGIFTRPSDGGKPVSMNTAPRLAPDHQSEPRTNAVAAVAKAAPVDLPKASLEPQQAPVPLHKKPRPAVTVPTIDATEAPAMGESGTAASSTGPDPAGESAARAAIEADGYKSVRIVSKGDGVWRAKALRGKTEVLLIVDATGSVTTAD